MIVKKIPGYPQQSISECGRLFWTKSGEEIDVFIGRNGYKQAYIYRGKKKLRHPKMIYKLVAITYLPPRPSKNHVIRHLDGDCNNNHKDNLAWGTQAENMEDLRKHSQNRQKLTEETKKAIIEKLIRGETRENIAIKYKLSFLTVNKIYWQLKDLNQLD